jgi:spore coat protein U-like protein
MNKSLLSVAIGLTALVSHPAQAATATGNFDVNINLSSACSYTKISDVVFDYSSMQPTPAKPTIPGAFTVKCTARLPYTLELDNGGLYTDEATRLNYSLDLNAKSGTGAGVPQPFTVSGSIPAGQGGNCATGGACNNVASANKQRTLIISY